MGRRVKPRARTKTVGAAVRPTAASSQRPRSSVVVNAVTDERVSLGERPASRSRVNTSKGASPEARVASSAEGDVEPDPAPEEHPRLASLAGAGTSSAPTNIDAVLRRFRERMDALIAGARAAPGPFTAAHRARFLEACLSEFAELLELLPAGTSGDLAKMEEIADQLGVNDLWRAYHRIGANDVPTRRARELHQRRAVVMLVDCISQVAPAVRELRRGRDVRLVIPTTRQLTWLRCTKLRDAITTLAAFAREDFAVWYRPEAARVDLRKLGVAIEAWRGRGRPRKTDESKLKQWDAILALLVDSGLATAETDADWIAEQWSTTKSEARGAWMTGQPRAWRLDVK